jgi:DNA-binding transcriptional regulator YhcF (GntR family)
MPQHPTRYEQLADDMTQAMSDGLLKPGERLPSVRQTCHATRRESVHRLPGLWTA